MAFFESFPAPVPPKPAPLPPRQPWQRSERVIPASVAVEALLVRAEAVAVAVGNFRAYPNGFLFTLIIRYRGRDESEMRGPGDLFGLRPPGGGDTDPDQVLRLGILYSDDSRAALVGEHRPPEPTEPGTLVLRPAGGGGGLHSWDANFWVHPLPPDGPVTFVVSWLAQGVTEARAEVGGTAIRAAAARAVTLWPDDPDTWGGGGMTSASAVSSSMMSSSSATAIAMPPSRPRPPEKGGS